MGNLCGQFVVVNMEGSNMDDSTFHQLVDKVLDHLADRIDDLLGDKLDVELHQGVLTIQGAGGGTYVINKQAPNREIWLSSPVSGALHFRLVDGIWQSTRNPDVRLFDLLAGELGIPI